jgi:hypothetical protein
MLHIYTHRIKTLSGRYFSGKGIGDGDPSQGNRLALRPYLLNFVGFHFDSFL